MGNRKSAAIDGKAAPVQRTSPTLLQGIGPFAVFLLLVVLVGGAYTLSSRPQEGAARAQQATDARVGYFAPEIVLQDLSGKTASLASYRGQVVLVNVWASWCAPCRAEMPDIEKVYRRLGAEGFTVLAVNVTDQDTEADARRLVQELSLSFPVVFDRDGRVSRAYRARTLPTSYLVGRDGVIQEIVVGGMTEATLEVRVRKLLQAKR